MPPAQKATLLEQLADYYTQLYDLVRQKGALESPESYLELADLYLQLEARDKARQVLEQSARALLQNRCIPQLPNADTAGLAFLTQDLALPYLSEADGAFLANLAQRMRQIADLADYSVVQGGQIILFQKEKKQSKWELFLDSLSVDERNKVEQGEHEAIKRIQSNKNATELNLCGLKLYRIPKEIKNLLQLTRLYLYDNQISDITVLKNLTKLQALWLWDNPINDIAALKDLTQLTELSLSNNPINDISVLKDLTHLQKLWLRNNQLNNISVLKDLYC